MKYFLLIFTLLALTSCRCIDYHDTQGNKLFVATFAMDTSADSLVANIGQNNVNVQKYNTNVDANTMNTLNNVVSLLEQILVRIPPIVAEKKPATTQPSTQPVATTQHM